MIDAKLTVSATSVWLSHKDACNASANVPLADIPDDDLRDASRALAYEWEDRQRVKEEGMTDEQG